MTCWRRVSGLVVALALGFACQAALAAPPPGPAAAADQAHGGPSHAAAEAGEAGAVNPLEWKGDLALWTAVVFLLLLAVLGKFAWKPIAQGLEKRETTIVDHLAHAEQQNEEARQLLSSYQQKLAQAQDEVRALLERARRDAEQAGRETLEKTRAEVRQEHQKALREIDAASAQAVKELAELSAGLAVQLAGKIVRGSLQPADHSQLIQDAIRDFTQVKAGRN
jgi:F-type H+-transporting ATPase subunit b